MPATGLSASSDNCDPCLTFTCYVRTDRTFLVVSIELYPLFELTPVFSGERISCIIRISQERRLSDSHDMRVMNDDSGRR